MTSIFLVGFMGCGKTHIGHMLAKAMSYHFIDMDHYLEESFGETIPAIFEKQGETFFRQLEHETLMSLKEKSNYVFSTGGGAPCFHNNIEIMNAAGTTIYLNVAPETIVKRILHQRDHRPILKGFANEIELLNFVEKKITERNQFYKQAKIIIDANGDADEILKKVMSYGL